MSEIEAIAGLLIAVGCVGVFWAGYGCGYDNGFGHGWREASSKRILEILKQNLAAIEKRPQLGRDHATPEEIKKAD
jgi:hypothetical protein